MVSGYIATLPLRGNCSGPYLYRTDGTRTKFRLKRNPVLDDLRVIDLYNDVIQSETPPTARKGHWAQEYHRLEEALVYIHSQFHDVSQMRRICEEMEKP